VPDPSIGAPVAGSTWFGFGGLIDPVTAPSLGVDDLYVIKFVIDGSPSDLIGLTAQYGSGLGNPDFSPLFDPGNPHTAAYSGVVAIPAPGSAALALLAGFVCSRRRRA
jgi:hypothetical protein